VIFSSVVYFCNEVELSGWGQSLSYPPV